MWYAQAEKRTHRYSLRTKNLDVARARLALFIARAPTDTFAPAPGEWAAQAKKMWRRAKENARMKGREHALDPEDVLALIAHQNYCCAVSGMRFRLTGAKNCPWAPSLDQIVPAGGYVYGNVRVVLSIVNTAMNTWGAGPFIELVEHMAAQKVTVSFNAMAAPVRAAQQAHNQAISSSCRCARKNSNLRPLPSEG